MLSDGVTERVSCVPFCAAPILQSVNEKKMQMNYPIPKVEDLHSALRDRSVFIVLEMDLALYIVCWTCHKHSIKFLLWLNLVNTSLSILTLDLLCLKWLCNGIHSGPAIFQRIMDFIISNILEVICYLDDNLIAEKDKKDFLDTLFKVVQRLQKSGFRLNKNKCKSEKNFVTWWS